MPKTFSRYASVGILNTLLHWAVFTSIMVLTPASQAIANLLAFGVAVSFSFIVNSHFTFKVKATPRRYFVFLISMGFLSLFTGLTADQLSLPPVVTLVVFSAISLIGGYFYSKNVVFRSVKS